MDFWIRLPFIGRLLVTASTALVVAGGAMLFVSARQEAAEIKADLQTELAKELETLPAALAETVVVGDFATLQQMLDRYVARPLVVAVKFRDTSGITLQSAEPPPASDVPAWFLAAFDFSDRVGRAPVAVGGHSYGELELQLTALGLASRAWRHLENHMAILLLAIAVDFLGIWLVLRFGLAPLKQLEKAAGRLAEGKLDIQLPAEGSPEFRRVIAAFNDMARALRERMDELAAILDNSSVAITFVKDRRQLWCNRRMAELFGYRLDEMRGQSTRMFYRDDADFETFGARAYAALLRGERFSGELPMRHRSGRPMWMRISGKAIRTDDLAAGSIWVLEDIDAQKDNEKELIAARESAEAANLAKSRFLATMSHEIRTPMNGVLGMAQLLLMPNLKDEDRLDYARTIINSGNTLLALLNDILDLSKVEAGRMELEKLAFDPEQMLHEIAALFAEQVEAKGLALDIAWQGAAGANFLGDPVRLRQMLANLLSNALKFTAAGSICISAHEMADDDGNAMLEFAVADTGIGIAQDKLALLFQPFSQVDPSTTRQFGGSGLGLSIVHRLASLMGGTVGVDSEPGKGSRFRFTARVERLAADGERRRVPRDGEVAAVAGAIAHAGYVMVVEDNVTNRKVIESLLKRQGVRYESVENGEQAVRAIEAGAQPALVLMDCQMPVMDGFAATTLVRRWESANGRARTPIIALTASAYDEDRRHCLEVGMDDFLTKPLALDALSAALGKWLGRG